MRNIIFTSMMLLAGAATATAQQGPPMGCFDREYSQAHLEAHPNQVARALTLMIHDETYQGNTDRFAYLVVDFANQGHVKRDGHGAQTLDQSLICWQSDAGQQGCSVECDGGSFVLVDETESTMTIATENLWVGDVEGCGGAIDLAEVQGREVKYRLNRVPMDVCLSKVVN